MTKAEFFQFPKQNVAKPEMLDVVFYLMDRLSESL